MYTENDFFSVARPSVLGKFEAGLLRAFEGKVKGKFWPPGDELRILTRVVRRAEVGFQ